MWVTAVVLAAGQSSRMGQPKPLLVVAGQPMISRVVQTALASAAAQVLVITGAAGAAVTALLTPVQAEVGARLRLVENPDYASGQASSIRTAVKALAPGCGAALFLLADQPFVSSALLASLIDAWRGGGRLAASAIDGEVRGAPAIFDRSLWPELLQLQGDSGARPLFQRHRELLVALPATAAELRDFDTPGDLVGL